VDILRDRGKNSDGYYLSGTAVTDAAKMMMVSDGGGAPNEMAKNETNRPCRGQKIHKSVHGIVVN
jgi:hypothetical protein